MSEKKLCPECKQEMSRLYNVNGKVAYYECSTCGNLLSSKGTYFIETGICEKALTA